MNGRVRSDGTDFRGPEEWARFLRLGHGCPGGNYDGR
jgi:hypothetical protein